MLTPWGAPESISTVERGFSVARSRRSWGVVLSKAYAEAYLSERARAQAQWFGEYYAFADDGAWSIPLLELPHIREKVRRFLPDGTGTEEAELYGLAERARPAYARDPFVQDLLKRRQRAGQLLIDTHAHIAPDVSIETVIASLDVAGVSKILLMPRGGSDETEVLEAYRRYPDRILPAYGGADIQTALMAGATLSLDGDITVFRGYRKDWWDENLDDVLAYLRRTLDGHTFAAIGEIRLRHYGNGPEIPEKERDYGFVPDHPFMLGLSDIAADAGLPLLIHLEAETPGDYIKFLDVRTDDDTISGFERLLAHNRRATVVWSHLGRASPKVLAGVLDRNPNLVTDISDVIPRGRNAQGVARESLRLYEEYALKNPVITPEGGLFPEWREFFERFPDRVTLATDAMSKRAYGRMYTALVEQLRDILDELSPATAEAIARGNARSIYRA